MSELDRVYKQVFKKEDVNLSSDKVELGIKQDADAAYSDAINKRKAANDLYSSLLAEVNKRLVSIDEARKSSESALEVLNRYEVAVKELGLEAPATVKQQKQNLQEGLKGTLTVFKKKLESFK
jgi:hypothetical protein